MNTNRDDLAVLAFISVLVLALLVLTVLAAQPPATGAGQAINVCISLAGCNGGR